MKKPQTYQTSRYYNQETHQVKKFTGQMMFLFSFGPAQWSLSSPTRDWTQTTAVKVLGGENVESQPLDCQEFLQMKT